MNFLELCQRVRQESGISGDGPESVLNQRAILAKVVEWVRQSDLDIQRWRNDWSFLWRKANASTIQGVQTYSLLALGIEDLKTLTSVEIDGHALSIVTWDEFKANKYHVPTQREAQPRVITKQPTGEYVLYPTPDAAYTLSIEYSTKPNPLKMDTDVSAIPDEYHDAIVLKALVYYASHEEDATLLDVARFRYETVLNELCRYYLPKLDFKYGTF